MSALPARTLAWDWEQAPASRAARPNAASAVAGRRTESSRRARQETRPRPQLKVIARRRRRRRLLPLALALVILTCACAVSPVAINMAGLRLRAQAVEVDKQAQQLQAQMRDLEAQAAGLSSAPVLQQQAEKMGMSSAQSVSYLAAGDGAADGVAGSAMVSDDEDPGVAWVATGGRGAGEVTAATSAP